uniref:RNA-directed RNA polymerase L n=1 Tax=Aulacomnium heterostichum bunyavirus 2 TaxID=2933071 RepID=A0A9C7LLN4_9VIRU|nr:RNA-dependent RNA polymerase [Aulacomnium heterostichum bunyavirus 2]CAI5383913.1 RNA-dependent RNA polymerase [Aulacomnium heterostichum bunyavirus 2]
MSFLGESSGTKHEDDDQQQLGEIVELEYSEGEGDEDGSCEESEWEEVSTEPEFEFDDEDEILANELEKKKFIFGDVSELDSETCICKAICDKNSALKIMSDMLNLTPNFENCNCIIDNIIRSHNMVFHDKGKPMSSYKVAFTDMFYRLRHELLFRTMCLALNIPTGHSDMPFSDLGIESNRTPDLIIVEGVVVKIVEVTAVSSIEKAAQNKGMDVLGFESKYKKEIDLLIDKGVTCIYMPLFFDMSNVDSPVNIEQLDTLIKNFNKNEPFIMLMKNFAKSMAILTNNLKQKLILPSAVLFSDVTPIKSKNESLSFLYKKSRLKPDRNHYKELVVSPYIYNKIINDKNRFFWMIDNNRFTDSQKVLFIINTVNHRVSLEQNANGATINYIREILINNNIIELLNFVKVKAGNVLLDSTKSDSGVKFFERVGEVKKEKQNEVIPLIVSHFEKEYRPVKFNMGKYKELIDKYTEINYHSVHYDRGYEDKIIDSIIKYDSNQGDDYGRDTNPGLLGNLKSNDVDIDEVMVPIRLNYIKSNRFDSGTMPIKLPKMKQPFILPIANLNSTSYCSLDNKNIGFLSKVKRLIEEKNPFTALIIENVMGDNYNMHTVSKLASETLNNLFKDRYDISNKLNILQRKLEKSCTSGTKQLSKTESPEYKTEYIELRDRYKSLTNEINTRKRTEGVGANISYIRLPCKNNKGHLRQLYDFEMRHFKDRKEQSTIEGVGIINNIESDYESDYNIFCNVSEILCDDRGPNPDKVLDKYVDDDATLLYDLKKEAIKKYDNLIEQVCRSYLGHAAALISRMAHSLMFYSQLPFSSDYIRVDNLGYKNVYLIVRGGKKIFKSKSSKLFRMLYPISEELLPWYRQGHKNLGSFTVLNINGEYFGLTPWSFLHESILTDCISFYSRITSFTFLNLNPSVDLKQQFCKVSINVLLSFHNRRQTEVMLANMRYILLSTLGDFTGVSQILPEFFDFNYDRFQLFIRNSLLINYPTYFKQLQGLKDSRSVGNKDINISDFVDSRLRNIFTRNIISSVEDLALMIYSTFLMTKAPYQKLAERARNLRGILEIHDQFEEQVGLQCTPEDQTNKLSVEMDQGLNKYTDDLFKCDFNFDPKFCALVGNFVDSIFINNNETESIETSWINIMNQPWDEMATSTGLRGDYDQVEDFWGQKGYFVVYKTLLSEPGFNDSLIKIFNSNIDDDTKRKIIRNMNELYKDKFMPDREFLIFHAVDKVQWRGGREIYVMDIETKTVQQPIEKFMGFLCKKLDNELISIPSDRRAQVIHHSIFEKDLPLKDMLTWYLTLDCSKWAPKSIFIKFVIMILNMSCIPNTFKTHFMNYIEKLYSKRIYFNKGEVETLSKNNKYKEVCNKFLKKDDKVNGYYLEMPYSWVMGIFNYTSSFMHAANQKYFSYILMKTSLISYKEETALVMFAHSDDSGGRLSVTSSMMAKRAIILYEIFLKSCNHLLSKKKSVVSRIYFEILSVIYLFKKLLALLPKFLGGLRFLPTDKGPAQDMLQSYSKSIEVMIAGSDFTISYLVMKIYSYLVWRFYYNKVPSVEDYRRPVQYLGLPDSHPLFVLLCGSDADILRLMRNGVDLSKIMTYVNTMSASMDGEGPIKPLKFEIKVKGIKRGFEEDIDTFREILDSWSIRNVNYHNTGLNALSFLRKLNDSGFVGSLVNESTVRRISRCYFLRTGDSAITRFRNVKLSVLMDSISLLQCYSSGEQTIRHVLKDIIGEDATRNIELEFEANKIGSERVIMLLKETLKSPLRIYKYLNMMGMKDRKILSTKRTLKPTQVQLVKSSRVFSANFDPACLVSYIKEENMRWALPNVKGLNTSNNEVKHFLNKLGFNFEEIDADMLLRVCRTYGRENTKNIYLYSRVPGEIRQIKTYSAFLTFLSVNSFHDQEILGLVLKMSDKEMGKEYIQPNLIEEVYTVNNIISISITLMEKCGVEFLKGLYFNELPEIDWVGGNITEFILHSKTLADLDVRYTLLTAQITYLEEKILGNEISAIMLEKSSYYTFLKSQKSRSGWYGKGEVFIKIDSNFYSFCLENSDITMLYSDKVGKLPQHHAEFILDVFEKIGLSIKSIKRPKYTNFNENHFGIDMANEISILPGREIEFGVPCIGLTNRNDFVDHLYNFEVELYKNDIMYIFSREGNEKFFKKIHLLPVKKTDLVATIKSIIRPKEFSDKMAELGVGDFDEFIFTEILTEYGKDLYLDFDEFIDNFAASRMYSILQEVHKTNISKIPKTIEFSPLPASEGSLVRILIDYSRNSKDKVMSVPVSLDANIMQLRSEYPEKMSTILGEKLGEYHKQIYSGVEQKEILDNYQIVSSETNINKKRLGLIRLMTYWGYGSLVNTIQEFTLSREDNNYKFFNTFNMMKTSPASYSDIFETVMPLINGVILRWRSMFNSLDYPIKWLSKLSDSIDAINNFMYSTVMCCYKYVSLGVRPTLYSMIYFNLLLGLMAEEDFVAELQSELSKSYILGSLPISWNNRFELIATLNSLKAVWCSNNKCDFEPSYNQKLQRYPNGIPHFKGLLRKFGVDTKGTDTYYNGFVNDNIISYILGMDNIFSDGVEYRLSNRISKLSDTEIEMCDYIKHPRPINDETLENDAWEDFNYECGMGDVDTDEIDILKEDLGDDIYKPPTTKKLKIKGKNIIMASISWIIYPNNSSNVGIISKIRQSGENIVIISDTYLFNFTRVFPNSGVRVVNLSKTLKERVKPFFAHYTLSKKLNNKTFISNLIKGTEYIYNDAEMRLIRDNWVRNSDGRICEPRDQGLENLLEVIVGEREMTSDSGVISTDKQEDNKELTDSLTEENVDKTHDFDEKMKMVNNVIEDLERKNTLSESGIKELKNKYLKKSIKDGLPISLILKSIINETDLLRLNDEILKNTSGISASDQMKMFLAPSYFSLGKGASRTDINPIKDKKLRSELNSLHGDLATMIGSNTLKLSFKFAKVVMANMKFWLMMVKNSKVKTDNKRFLLTLFTMICNNVTVSNEEDDDQMMQLILNKISIYISNDGEEKDDEDMFNLIFDIIPASRMKYRAQGS